MTEVLDFIAKGRDDASSSLNRIRTNVVALTKSMEGLQQVSGKQGQALGKELVALTNYVKTLPQQAKHVDDFTRKWRDMRSQLHETSGAISKEMVPALGALGLGGITAGLSIAGVVSKVKELGDSGANLLNFSRQTGFAREEVEKWTGTAELFGSSTEEMTTALSSFSRQMQLLKTLPGGGDLFEKLMLSDRSGQGRQLALELQKIMRGVGTDAEKLNKTLPLTIDYLRKTYNVANEPYTRTLAQQFGLEAFSGLFRFTKQQTDEFFADLRKLRGEPLPTADIDAYRLSTTRLNAALEGLEKAVAGPLLPGLTVVNTAIATFIGQNKEEIGHAVTDFVTELTTDLKALAPLIPIFQAIGTILNQVKAGADAAGRVGHEYLRRKNVTADAPDSPMAKLMQGLRESVSEIDPKSPIRTKDFDIRPGAGPGGAPIPHGQSGGSVERTGMAVIHKGETLIPAHGPFGQQQSHQKLEENTRQVASNTEQMHKLIDVLQKMLDQSGVSAMGGFGGEGAGAYGQGQGPMFRPGTAPSGTPTSSSRTGTHAPGGRVTPQVPKLPEAITPPPAGVPTQPPATSIPPPELMPNVGDLASGGIVRARPGGTIVRLGESGQDEMVIPKSRLPHMADGGVARPGTIAVVGEGGEDEYVVPSGGLSKIPANALAFISGIGATETSFRKSEAYNERYNQASNNANVRQYGQEGADYGYYQMNQRDATEAVSKYGIDAETAKHLYGGPDHGSTLDEQTNAVHQYIQRRWPEQYKNLVENGDFEGLRKVAKGTWFGLKDHLDVANKEFKDPYLARQATQPLGPGAQAAATTTRPSGTWPVYPGIMQDTGFTKEQQAARPRYYSGDVSIENQPGLYKFGTGGTGREGQSAGASAPYGDFNVNVGPVAGLPGGSSTGGVGSEGVKWAYPAWAGYADKPEGNYVWDTKFNAWRKGVEIHAAGGGAPTRITTTPSSYENMKTEGCFGIEKERFEDFKTAADAEIAARGPLFMHTRPVLDADGNITGGRSYLTHSKVLPSQEWDKYKTEVWSPSGVTTGRSPLATALPGGFATPFKRGGDVSLGMPTLRDQPGPVKPPPAPPVSVAPPPPPISDAAKDPAAAAKQEDVPSHQSGAWNTRGGLARLHRGEMVLPRDVAEPLRSEMDSGAVLKADIGGFRPRRLTAAQIDTFGREREREGRPLPGIIRDIYAFNLAHHIGSKFDTSSFRRSTNVESDQMGPPIPAKPIDETLARGPLSRAAGATNLDAIQGPGYFESLGAKRAEVGKLGGIAAQARQKVEGSADLNVNINAPRGTNVRASADGLFKQVQLNRRLSMPQANEQSARGR